MARPVTGYRIANVAFEKFDLPQVRSEVFAAATDEVIEGAHSGAARDESVDEVRTDETRRPGDEDPAPLQNWYGQRSFSLSRDPAGTTYALMTFDIGCRYTPRLSIMRGA